jgi:hypothetical protein
MAVRHVLRPGGKETACNRPVLELPRGHTAGHELEPIRCHECRKVLLRRPQLVWGILAELRASGLETPDMSQLRIRAPAMSPRQRLAMVRRLERQRREKQDAARKAEEASGS